MHDEGAKSTTKIFANIFISFIGAGILGMPFAFKEVRSMFHHFSSDLVTSLLQSTCICLFDSFIPFRLSIAGGSG